MALTFLKTSFLQNLLEELCFVLALVILKEITFFSELNKEANG